MERSTSLGTQPAVDFASLDFGHVEQFTPDQERAVLAAFHRVPVSVRLPRPSKRRLALDILARVARGTSPQDFGRRFEGDYVSGQRLITGWLADAGLDPATFQGCAHRFRAHRDAHRNASVYVAGLLLGLFQLPPAEVPKANAIRWDNIARVPPTEAREVLARFNAEPRWSAAAVDDDAYYTGATTYDCGTAIERLFNAEPAAATWLKDHIRHEPNTSIQRTPFVPMASEARYRLVRLEWAPSALNQAPPYDRDESTAQRGHASERRWDAYLAALEHYPDPTSLVDVPQQAGGFHEPWYAQPTTRQTALEAAAADNRDILERAGFVPGGQGVALEHLHNHRCEMPWSVVFELGETQAVGFIYLEYDAGGMAMEERNTYRPVRLVRPTANELALYAIEAEMVPSRPLAAEGGVA